MEKILGLIKQVFMGEGKAGTLWRCEGGEGFKNINHSERGKVDIHTLHTYNEKTRDRLSVFEKRDIVYCITAEERD
jgi:hypothetical protein